MVFPDFGKWEQELNTRIKQPDGAGGSRPAKTGEKRKKGRGSTAVFEEMREDILSLRLAPGAPLDEVALGKRFGLSRTPVREALLMLSHEDLVTILPGRSAIVAPHTMSNAPEYMDTHMLLMRAVLRLAAEAHSPEAIAEIRACERAYAQAERGGRTDDIIAAYIAFHRAIAFASGNEFLAKFYALTVDYGRRMLLLYYYPVRDAAEAERCIAENAAMAEAIENGDIELAEQLATDHILSQLRVIQQAFAPRAGAKFSMNPASNPISVK